MAGPDDILDAVRGRTPIDAREQQSLTAFVEHFARLSEPFSETADPVHVTGSAIVVGDRGVVLHRHKRLGIWIQPGGHIDPGEDPWDGARREAREETGLDVRHPDGGPELVHVDVHPGPRGHTHLDLRYLLIAPDADPAPPPEESQDVRWFDWDAAIEIADQGLSGALVGLRARFEHTRFEHTR
jgi:8-oxo-dGTP pyrophosphatase MutT (NUDIX family)